MRCASKDEPVLIRRASESDLGRLAEIQALCPEAAQWSKVRDFLSYDVLVAVPQDSIVGFAVAREIGMGESELLNLAVAPEWRRRGIGRRLIESLHALRPGALFLEVRESNQAARKFYDVLGFQEVGRRTGYYVSPSESAVVMKIHSCYCHK